jgi:hypothetical protein
MTGEDHANQSFCDLRRCDARGTAGFGGQRSQRAAARAVSEDEYGLQVPDFAPGLGTLYVDPQTLPEGPFLGYDHKGHLVTTIYMVPLKDMDGQKSFADLSSPGGNVDHVSLNYNGGHPGVEEPHYHIILWHVPKSEEVTVAQ